MTDADSQDDANFTLSLKNWEAGLTIQSQTNLIITAFSSSMFVVHVLQFCAFSLSSLSLSDCVLRLLCVYYCSIVESCCVKDHDQLLSNHPDQMVDQILFVLTFLRSTEKN